MGYFDECFVKYFEDVDMCLRMARSGWQVMHYGGAACYHLEGRGSRNPASLDAWLHLRSYLRWRRKWARSAEVLAALPQKRRRAA